MVKPTGTSDSPLRAADDLAGLAVVFHEVAQLFLVLEPADRVVGEAAHAPAVQVLVVVVHDLHDRRVRGHSAEEVSDWMSVSIQTLRTVGNPDQLTRIPHPMRQRNHVYRRRCGDRPLSSPHLRNDPPKPQLSLASGALPAGPGGRVQARTTACARPVGLAPIGPDARIGWGGTPARSSGLPSGERRPCDR
jgi:hypothetical protein